MKLHQIKSGSSIRAVTIDGEGVKVGDFLTFHYLNELGGYCTVYGTNMETEILLDKETDLIQIKDYYLINN